MEPQEKNRIKSKARVIPFCPEFVTTCCFLRFLVAIPLLREKTTHIATDGQEKAVYAPFSTSIG
jgi:hypothetical protein